MYMFGEKATRYKIEIYTLGPKSLLAYLNVIRIRERKIETANMLLHYLQLQLASTWCRRMLDLDSQD